MNLFLTGEFKQCKTGKRVLEDYLKNYNQFNQGLILDFVKLGCFFPMVAISMPPHVEFG